MERHDGNTLLEILLVLAVSSLLIVLAIRYFTVVDLNLRVAQTISRIDILSRASYDWLQAERAADFTSISVGRLTKSGLISAKDLKNPWGGDIAIERGSTGEHVKITIENINSHACEDLRRHLGPIAYLEAPAASCQSSSDEPEKKIQYWGEF